MNKKAIQMTAAIAMKTEATGIALFLLRVSGSVSN